VNPLFCFAVIPLLDFTVLNLFRQRNLLQVASRQTLHQNLAFRLLQVFLLYPLWIGKHCRAQYNGWTTRSCHCYSWIPEERVAKSAHRWQSKLTISRI